MKKTIFPLVAIGLSLFLASCVTILSTDATTTLFPDERWKISYEILFDGVEFAEAGDTVSEGLESLKQMAMLEGVVVKSKQLPAEAGNIPYQVILTGKGLDSLNTMLGVENAFSFTLEGGKKIYHFNLDAVSIVTGGLSIGSTADFSFTLEGIELLNTNAQSQTVVSASWYNPTEIMYADFELKRGGLGNDFPWWIIPVVLGGLVVISLAILFATGVFKKKPQRGYGTPPALFPPSVPLPPIPGARSASPPPVPAAPKGGSAVPPPVPPSVPMAKIETPPQPPVTPNDQATVVAPRKQKK